MLKSFLQLCCIYSHEDTKIQSKRLNDTKQSVDFYYLFHLCFSLVSKLWTTKVWDKVDLWDCRDLISTDDFIFIIKKATYLQKMAIKAQPQVFYVTKQSINQAYNKSYNSFTICFHS